MTQRIPPGRSARVLVLLCTLVLALPACEATPMDPTAGDSARAGDAPAAVSSARVGGAPMGARIAALRAATARYHRMEKAVEDGYSVLVRHPETGAACLESEAGGMGRHMLKEELMDDEVVVETPEVLIYEPTRNGRMRLVGVEYLIPYDIRGANETPPELFGQTFEQNGTFRVWALHAYVWRHNPDGLFTAWNPAITCEHDPEA